MPGGPRLSPSRYLRLPSPRRRGADEGAPLPPRRLRFMGESDESFVELGDQSRGPAHRARRALRGLPCARDRMWLRPAAACAPPPRVRGHLSGDRRAQAAGALVRAEARRRRIPVPSRGHRQRAVQPRRQVGGARPRAGRRPIRRDRGVQPVHAHVARRRPGLSSGSCRARSRSTVGPRRRSSSSTQGGRIPPRPIRSGRRCRSSASRDAATSRRTIPSIGSVTNSGWLVLTGDRGRPRCRPVRPSYGTWSRRPTDRQRQPGYQDLFVFNRLEDALRHR